jgi:hypothetical protein
VSLECWCKSISTFGGKSLSGQSDARTIATEEAWEGNSPLDNITNTNYNTPMKLIENNVSIEQIGNVTESAQFTMKSSRKAFQILSDLYSDKPLAIVRELGCNASDSMTDAGKKGQPFHIHLPNTLEPWLTIQDFGTGISHENIYAIYSTYFESTKTNTNAQIGCLGLGSKSPFCYTDNFSVTSIVDGEKRIYNAYFNEQNTPTISLMSTTKTDEANGVAIQIPIKEKDFSSFINAVARSFRFFDVKPTISGGSVAWDTETPMFKGDDWMFYDKSNSYEAYAIMGGVTYPIEQRHLEDKYNTIVRKGIVLKFEMGELDFAPSREHLSYDDTTIKALNDKLAKVMGEMKSKVKDQILAKDNILEAMRAIVYFNERFAYYGQSAFELKDVVYNGIDITEPYKALKGIWPEVKQFFKRSYRKQVNENTGYNLDSKYSWYVDNSEIKNPVNRVKSFVRDNDKSCHFISPDGRDALVKAGFPNDMFLDVSTLPSPTAKRKLVNGNVVVKAKEDITIYNMDTTYNVSWKSRILEPNDDTPEYYIVKGKTWEINLKPKNLRVIESKDRLITYGEAFGFNGRKVVMVGPRDEAKLKARGCKPLMDLLNKQDASWVDASEVATISHYRGYDDDVVKQKSFDNLDDSNPIKIMVKKINALRKKYKAINNVMHLFDNVKDKGTIEKIPCAGSQFVLESLLGSWSDREEFLAVAKALEKK